MSLHHRLLKLGGFTNIELHQSSPHGLADNHELCHSDRQLEPSRTRAAGIDVNHSVTLLDRRFVRMPRHDRAKSGRNRIEVQLGNIVQDEDEGLSDLQHLGLRYSSSPRAMIVVPANRSNRGERSQLFENACVPDVPSVNNLVAAAQELQCLRAQEAMRIRDESYTWHGEGRSMAFTGRLADALDGERRSSGNTSLDIKQWAENVDVRATELVDEPASELPCTLHGPEHFRAKPDNAFLELRLPVPALFGIASESSESTIGDDVDRHVLEASSHEEVRQLPAQQIIESQFPPHGVKERFCFGL